MPLFSSGSVDSTPPTTGESVRGGLVREERERGGREGEREGGAGKGRKGERTENSK